MASATAWRDVCESGSFVRIVRIVYENSGREGLSVGRVLVRQGEESRGVGVVGVVVSICIEGGGKAGRRIGSGWGRFSDGNGWRDG